MSSLFEIDSLRLSQAIGITLIHSIWQGLVIGAALSTILRVMRHRSPRERYGVCLVGMIAMLTATATTLLLTLQGGGARLGHSSIHPFDLAQGLLVSERLQPVLPWLTMFWMIGAMSLNLRLVIRMLLAERIKRSGLSEAASVWTEELALLQEKLKIGKRIRVMSSARVCIPSVIGWVRPIVLVPLGLTAELTSIQIRAILAHELAHIQRHDYIVNLVQSVFESLLFFHPVTWWLSDRLRNEREFCCDDLAVSVTPSALHYARALAALEELRGTKIETSIASTGGSLMKRLSRILESAGPEASSTARWLAPVIGLLSVVAIIATLSTGCGNETGKDAVAAPTALVESRDGSSSSLSPESIRESIVSSVRLAVENGTLSSEEAECTILLLNETDLECITEECYQVSYSECCPDGSPPACCGDQGASLKTIPFQDAQGRTGELRVAFVNERP